MLNNSTTLTTADGGGFFGTLRWCVLSSFALLVASTVLRLPPWVSMLGGGLPLIWYHAMYLTPRAKRGLSQTAIDSVYYFGFLVTIAALGVSAVTLAWSGGNEPLANIAFQFGLGLLATGYAVLARMHLTSISTLVDDASPEAVLDRYVQRSRELVTNVEMASTQFVELSNNLMLKSQEVADTARLTTERAMLEVARMFDEELRGTLASARQGLTEIRGLVSETSFTQEREALVRSVRETLDCVTNLNRALAEFAERSSEGAQTARGVALASGTLNTTLVQFQEHLDRIGGPQGQMVKAAEALGTAQSAVVESTELLGSTVGQLGEMTGTVSGIGLTFKNIRTLTNKANEQMEALVHTAERLDEATRHLERSAAATEGLASSVDKVTQAMPALGARATALDSQFEELRQVAVAVEQDLQSIPRPTREVIDLSIELKAALSSVQQVLSEAASSGSSLAGHTAEQAAALEKSHLLAQQVGAVTGAAERIIGVLQRLGETVEGLHANLGASTGSLNTALSTATQSLEGDVKRSSDAARVFGERLTNVAQIIIDRTQGARPL